MGDVYSEVEFVIYWFGFLGFDINCCLWVFRWFEEEVRRIVLKMWIGE